MIAICQQCGQVFLTRRSRNKPKFCSRLCYERFRSQQKPPAPMKQKQCEMCGKIFEVDPKAFKQAKFCPNCRHAAALERDRKRNQRKREMKQEATK